MSVMQGVLVLKTLLDAVCCAGFVVFSQPGMALMFFGFAIADAGALWLAPGP